MGEEISPLPLTSTTMTAAQAYGELRRLRPSKTARSRWRIATTSKDMHMGAGTPLTVHIQVWIGEGFKM